MKKLLDTDICIYIIKKKPESVVKKLMALDPGDVGISTITLSELYYGIAKSQYPDRNRQALEGFLIPLEISDYNASACGYYGKIRSELEASGKSIGGNDLFIAAHALSLGLPLVTNNKKEFSRIKGLKVEAWV